MTVPASPVEHFWTNEMKVVLAAAKTLQATMSFRWHHINVGDERGTLQQGWVVRETGQIEWRDVPHFYEPPAIRKGE